MPTTLLNLAAKSAVDPNTAAGRALDQAPHTPTNVGDLERAVCLGVGGGLWAFGLNGRGPGVLSMLVGGALLYRGLTGHCSGYQALGMSTAKRGKQTAVPAGEGVKVVESVTVRGSPTAVYEEWRKLDSLPRFMSHLREVRDEGNYRSHWVARGPLGVSVEWDAETITDRPGEVISWRSLPGSDVDTAGSVHFRPAATGKDTVVTVELKYRPPAGKLGAAAARLLGDAPEQQVRDDLQRFKQLMEGGQ